MLQGAAPTADVIGPIPGDQPTQFGGFDLRRQGYVEEEYFVTGVASGYWVNGDLTADGTWDAVPDSSAHFTTRIVVHRPTSWGRFDGTVVVEWLNVSLGTDFAPEWRYLHREIMRRGSIYVGVSVQRAGIAGGGLIPGPHLQLTHPLRYAPLRHPGDAYAFDIFSQVGRALRGGRRFLGHTPRRIIAVGESQSAVFLTTYINAVDRLAEVYDGFLLHGRAGGGAPIDGVIRSRQHPLEFSVEEWAEDISRIGHRIREDTRVPVMIVQAETDLALLKGIRARQEDTDRIRTWEIAGAAHADTYLILGGLVDDGKVTAPGLALTLRPMPLPTGGLPVPVPSPTSENSINAGPQQHYVLQAALWHLVAWSAGGDPPPTAPRLEIGPSGALRRAGDGIVLGGLRTPWVDVPTMAYIGLGQTGRGFAPLYGTTLPFSMSELLARYGRGSVYRERFRLATREAVRKGYLLAADEEEIVAVGTAQWPTWPVL